MDENIPAYLEHEIISILECWFKPYPRFYIIASDIDCKHKKVEDAVLIDYNFNELPNKYNNTLTQGKKNIHDILDNKLVSLCFKKEDYNQINRIKKLSREKEDNDEEELIEDKTQRLYVDRFYIKFYETENDVFVDIKRKY